MTVVPSVELADVARLAEGDVDRLHVLQRIVEHARSLVPGCTAAGLTVSAGAGEEDVAATDDRVLRCHDAQFGADRTGPGQEALRFRESRRIDDMAAEERWPEFTRTARESGFASCLAMPLLTEGPDATALNLYSDQPHTFAGTTFDVALFFAAQGGVRLDNADRFREGRELVEHLHRTLTSRSLIERAKGVLMSRHQLSSEQAFELLRSRSQQSHQKLRDVAVSVLRDQDPEHFSEGVPFTPARPPSGAGR